MNTHRLPHCDFDPENLHTRVRIVVPGRLDAISPAVEKIMAEARAMECSKGKEFEIETALREALANAIRHGCAHDATESVEVCVACDEGKGMLIVVRDPGPGFDPAAIASPTVGHNIYRHHGRGIYLINQLMDEVSFEKGGTEIRMRKR
jgi:serine/threonine-protein kinase RsbW